MRMLRRIADVAREDLLEQTRSENELEDGCSLQSEMRELASLAEEENQTQSRS